MLEIKVRSLACAFALSCAVSSFAIAQGLAPAESSAEIIDTADRDSQLEKLVIRWNELRNTANREALPEVFHPDDRATAALVYANQRPAIVRVRILGIRQAADGRVNIRVARSWGGRNPGQFVDTLQASALDGQWFLRIPGGTLTGQAAKAAPARTQESSPRASSSTTRFASWTRICEMAQVSRSTCFLEAAPAHPVTNKTLITWRVQLLDDESAASVVLIPAGVTITPGLTLSLSTNQSSQVLFRICNAEHCDVQFRMEADLVETIGKRSDVPVKYMNQAGEIVEFSVSMNGFREGVESIRAGIN